jgi:bifunctional UDP-N-acetylglucosamine pyrophosphorylase/glucosamine-1-phosphate N-acetyltransferase
MIFEMAEGCQAAVLAAGKGTRMKSARAKVLHPVLGMPVLEHVLRALATVAPQPVAVVVGHQAEEVERAFADRGLTFVRQDPPLGTGHALQSARAVFAQDPRRALLVVNGDLPLLRGSTVAELLRAHERSDRAATLLTVELDDPGAYGRILRDADGGVAAIVEARDASSDERRIREINAGVYVFAVAPLLDVLDRLQPKNAQGEYYLTDVIGLLAQAGKRVGAFPAADPEEALGVNTLAELATAGRRLADRVVGSLLAAGVRIEDPATTYVGPDVEVEPDAVLRPFTILEGRTVIRAGASVGPFVRLVDTQVGPDAQILDHCLLRESVVEAGASIGPFSHLRPESRVGPRAKVGNFVELKKSVIGEGSKAPHLSYVGDATVGPGVNIGAGTITCNYDGSAKHPTRIEAGAFIGSHTTLIAPVTVGEGAYVAAGSAITEDVPPHALALGRARQVNKEGWARARRQKLDAAAAGRGKGQG